MGQNDPVLFVDEAPATHYTPTSYSLQRRGWGRREWDRSGGAPHPALSAISYRGYFDVTKTSGLIADPRLRYRGAQSSIDGNQIPAARPVSVFHNSSATNVGVEWESSPGEI